MVWIVDGELGEKDDWGVSLVKSLPADMTLCRGVLGQAPKTSRWRGVEGVTGLRLEGED
jgi:hypothetical protein